MRLSTALLAGGVLVVGLACGGGSGGESAEPEDVGADLPDAREILEPTCGAFLSCEGDTPHCDEDAGRCVECLGDEHCPASRPTCHLEGRRCVACLEDSDCEDGRCNEIRGICGGCLDDTDCAAPVPVCNELSGDCVACLNDGDCADDGAGRCLPGGWRCVECLAARDCENPTPACDAINNACRGCRTDAECSASSAGTMCDTDSGRCVACLEAADCPREAPVCDADEGRCGPCTGDEHCPEETPWCHVDSGACSDCRDAGDCEPPRHLCKEGFGCVACLEDQDCGDEAEPYCIEAKGTCGQCLEDGHCAEPTHPVCPAGGGSCVQCRDDAGCTTPTGTCKLEDGRCVQCLGDTDCPPLRPFCLPELLHCGECAADYHCPAERPRCDLKDHRCVECTGDSHCPAERPTCEGARGRCAICMHPGGCTGGRQCFVVECRERPTTPDADGDSYSDATDNCPEHANYGQRDLDGDGEGDVCDGDVDGDSVPDESDNCPLRLNPGQEDQDGDGWGDTCEGAPTGDPPGYLCPTVEHQERTYADGFESGSFVGWAVPVGAASTDERGEVDTFVAPELTAESAHTGRYGARFDKVLFPAEQDRALTLHPCMPLGAGVDLSLWVRPAQTGHCCGQFGSAGLRLTFRQGTRERRLNYLWAHSTQPDTRDERFIRLGDPPFRWVPDQWQQLEVALHEELEEHFNIGDPANVLLLEVHIFSHFANGSPGGFDVDELGLRPAE